MPDQDFQIKIRTTADTTGIKQTEAELAKLKQETKAVTAAPGAAAGAGEAAGAGGLIGSLIGSFGGIAILGLVETVASRISAWAENLKHAAEEQRGLNREIDQAVRSYEKIRTPEQWDRENNKIEEQIQKLRDKRAVETDPSIRAQLDYEIAAYERQQTDLAILVRLGLERAQAEEKVKLAIRDQINALAEGDRSSQRAVAASENRARIENQLTDLRAKGLSAAVDLARERGIISETQAIAAKAKIQRDADDEDFNRSQRTADQKIRTINDEIARTKSQREEAQKNFETAQSTEARSLKARKDAARLTQETKDADQGAAEAKQKAIDAEKIAFSGAPGAAEEAQAAKDAADAAKREADEKHRLLSAEESYVRQLDHGKDDLEAELKLTRAILEDRQRAEEAAKKRGADIPDIEAQKKGDQELHDARRENQDFSLRGLNDQADRLSEIARRTDLTPSEQSALRDAQINTEKELRDKQIQAGKDARAADAEYVRGRYEGPTAGAGNNGLIDYFTRGAGAPRGAETSKQQLDQILNELRSMKEMWR